MNNKEILLAARPDQSLQIYSALCKEQKFKFDYVTFKVVPPWLKKIINHPKLVCINKNASFVVWGTIKHLLIKKYKFKFAKKWSDKHILDKIVIKKIKRNDYKIIHFWPDNCGVNYSKYIKSNSSCFIISDIHMPNPAVVYNEMLPIYKKYGIDPQNTSLYKEINIQKDYLKYSNNVLVPSSYVAETYKQQYPNKRYFIVPYGIRYLKYNKKEITLIKDFVYIGTISLEKGADLLLDFFSNHSEFNLHIFGNIINEQKNIFEKYRNINNIYFHGHIAKSELQQTIKTYDVGIHLSRFDAYSLAVGEIIGSGLPVIVSDKTGNADDIIKNGFGIVTDLSKISIENSIKKITDLNEYRKYQNNIFSYTSNNPKDYGKLMIDFYNEILNNQLIQ